MLLYSKLRLLAVRANSAGNIAVIGKNLAVKTGAIGNATLTQPKEAYYFRFLWLSRGPRTLCPPDEIGAIKPKELKLTIQDDPTRLPPLAPCPAMSITHDNLPMPATLVSHAHTAEVYHAKKN
ncbi:hypothetical protein [Pseudopelagicola sp. nBUS_19]|uniref:hypothetical protein n=1 Tax=Pseudopelagicola sp. nBUS_19 TaxID=3395316 RepID=UPI003EBEAF85